MNSACIIAACAAASRAAQQSKTNSHFSDGKGFEVYYKVKLRKYYHFEAMTLVSFVDNYYTGSIYAPIVTPYFKPVKIPARTMAIEEVFSVAASKCPEGIDKYIKANLETFDESPLWKLNDNNVILKYVSELNQELTIDLDPSSLKYTSQFCWEVC